MGISLIAALEIFTNSSDLEIVAKQGRPGGKFAIGIFRGPGHNFKPMLTSEPFAEKLEDAVEEVKKILESIEQTMVKDFADQHSLLSRHLNPSSLEIDTSRILNPQLITQILKELRQHQVASTYKMLAPVS